VNSREICAQDFLQGREVFTEVDKPESAGVNKCEQSRGPRDFGLVRRRTSATDSESSTLAARLIQNLKSAIQNLFRRL
jgi:hypothetical protein